MHCRGSRVWHAAVVAAAVCGALGDVAFGLSKDVLSWGEARRRCTGVTSNFWGRLDSGGAAAPHRNAARPDLSRGRGSRFGCCSGTEFDSVFQVDVSLLNHSVGPLSLRGEGESRFGCCSKPEFDPVIQVGEFLLNTSVSPLSLRERARVRGFWPLTRFMRP